VFVWGKFVVWWVPPYWKKWNLMFLQLFYVYLDMIKLLRFFIVIVFISKAHSQLNFTREYNLEAPIKNISLKKYTILAQKQTGLFIPRNQIFSHYLK
jgi:hypothetical protein